MRALVLSASLAVASPISAAQSGDENLTVIQDWILYTDAENALYHHFLSQAQERLDARAREVATIDTAAAWRARQTAVRTAIAEAMGPFPETTPLNPRVLGTLAKDGYHVEKLVYESQPSFYVTAALFVPEGLDRPAPGILFCSGHYEEAFRHPAYQTLILNLVRKGFVVLAYDPIGQGERLQYLDPATGKSRIGFPTHEHSYPGAQQLLLGRAPANLMTWDAIRGIDYLMSREEVDAERIGVTGHSGGGTQTAYLGAVDERVRAAAPWAYITSFKRLLASRGPQDAEQNLFHGIARGLDHADFLEVRAPKPTLVVATTRDFFNITGTRETVAEARRAFEALGAPDALRLVEDDAGHDSTRQNREATYAFFQRALAQPGSPVEEPTPLLAPEELRITATGQVASSLGGETAFRLNRAAARAMTGRARTNVSAPAARLAGFIAPAESGKPVFVGRYRRDGYHVEKYFVHGEGDYVIPYLVMLPASAEPHPALVYLHPGGKAVEAQPAGEMEQLVKQGYAVIAPDLIGIGEMGPGRFRGDAYIDGVSYNVWFGYMLIGRSIVGVRAGDVLRVVATVTARDDVEDGDVVAVARGSLGPVLLHAAAFAPDAFSRVALVAAPRSYAPLVERERYPAELVHAAVPGALTVYDLPDLAASLTARPLVLPETVDVGSALAEWLSR
jgi:cephalosporin-C deacetylase-like acetyl esterase